MKVASLCAMGVVLLSCAVAQADQVVAERPDNTVGGGFGAGSGVLIGGALGGPFGALAGAGIGWLAGSSVQQASGASVESTALVGFSQGAIMVLEAAQAQPHLAGRVIAFAGRYAKLPTAAPERTTLHLFHGKQDDVIHYSHTVHAAERLVQLGADLTADVVPFTGHGISEELQDLLVERLRGHIPKHVWEEAMRNAPG